MASRFYRRRRRFRGRRPLAVLLRTARSGVDATGGAQTRVTARWGGGHAGEVPGRELVPVVSQPTARTKPSRNQMVGDRQIGPEEANGQSKRSPICITRVVGVSKGHPERCSGTRSFVVRQSPGEQRTAAK